MNDKCVGPVTKAEALGMVNHHLNARFIDVSDLIELLTWQSKLTLWLLQEHAANNTPPTS
jgi:hypothetical protein